MLRKPVQSLLGFLSVVFGLIVLTTVHAVEATAEVGLKQGDPIGVFYVTKIAGAEDDGVDAGQELCYRCRYGSRPMVIVFARKTDGKLPDFMKVLDETIAKNEEANLKGLVALLGEDPEKLATDATSLLAKSKVKRVPFAVAKESQTGPLNYRLSPEAPVTIVVANDSQVVSSRTSNADAIDIDAVMADVKGMLAH